MLLSEFIDRTNFHPSATEWSVINKEYMSSTLTKDAWCKKWKKEHQLGASCRMTNTIIDLEREIEKLRAELEKVKVAHDKEIINLCEKHQKEISGYKSSIDELNSKLSRISHIINS